MAVSLLAKWLTHYDPVHRGWTNAGIANGVCATSGFFFPRMRGGYHLRRAIGDVPSSADAIVGSTGAGGETISTFPWVGHAAETAYVYRLFAINGGGCENIDDVVAEDVGFDGAGEWTGGKPVAPKDVRVAALSGGRYRIAWTYDLAESDEVPVSFRIYGDGGSGTMDYGAAAGEVEGGVGRLHYAFETPGFADGVRVRWAVRAVNANGLEDGNVVTVVAEARASGPDGTPSVRVVREAVDVYGA